MNEPATESAVQTTPPIISAATMPLVPFSPTATMTTEARMSVISVMPLTGLEPTMAMALAATVVKRKAMTVTSTMPTRAKSKLPSITPNQKNRNVRMMVTMLPMAITLKEISRLVRSCSLSTALPPFISCAASPTALLMMPQDLIMPMMPAMAMPPIPIDLP